MPGKREPSKHITNDELREVGSFVRAALRLALHEVRGIRDAEDAIGLNKSLASRLLRARSAEEPLRVVQLLPSPEGLRLCAQLIAGTDNPTRREGAEQLIQAARRLEHVASKFQGKSRGLSIAVAAMLRPQESELRATDTSEYHRAGMSIYGIAARSRHVCYCFDLGPNDVSVTFVQQWKGIQRLRSGTRYSLATWRRQSKFEYQSFALDGSELLPARFIVQSMSTLRPDEVDVLRTDDRYIVVLPASTPAVGKNINLATAARSVMSRALWELDRTVVLRSRLPCEYLTLDILLHNSVEPPDAVVGVIDSAVDVAIDVSSQQVDVLARVRAQPMAVSLDGTDVNSVGLDPVREILRTRHIDSNQLRCWRYECHHPIVGTELRVLLPPATSNPRDDR
jgi:hypothetical protein